MADEPREGDADRSFFAGDRVRSRTNQQAGYVDGFRQSERLGFRYVVVWDDESGYSLVPADDLMLEAWPSEPEPRQGTDDA